MSKQKQDKQGGGWQFPRPLEIIKCKEGNKEYMKERPARKPYGMIRSRWLRWPSRTFTPNGNTRPILRRR